MMTINIVAVANQEFFVQLDGRAYNLILHAATECVTVSVKRDDVQLISGVRLTPGTPLLPYHYQESGNFALLTQEDSLPDFAQFGVTQFLVYFSQSEIDALRAA